MKALIFDFDGLVLDTETPEVEVWSEIFREHGVAFPDSLWIDLLGRGAEQVTEFPPQALARLLGRAIDEEAVAEDCLRRRLAIMDGLPLRAGVPELLEEARAQGIPTALCSSSRRPWIERHLVPRGLLDRFRPQVTAELAPRAKPFPDLYLETLRQLGLDAKDAVALEDSPNGVAAARAAGIFTVAVPAPVSRSLDFRAANHRIDSLEGVTLSHLRDWHAATVG